MHLRSSFRSSPLRSAAALLGASLLLAACSGAAGSTAGATGAGTAGHAGSAGSAAESAAPSVDWVQLLSPGPDQSAGPAVNASANPATQPPAAGQPAKPGSTAISTTKAAGLLSQVNHLLDELNGDLSNADAAANNAGE
jgi:hypothetical protein